MGFKDVKDDAEFKAWGADIDAKDAVFRAKLAQLALGPASQAAFGSDPEAAIASGEQGLDAVDRRGGRLELPRRM